MLLLASIATGFNWVARDHRQTLVVRDGARLPRSLLPMTIHDHFCSLRLLSGNGKHNKIMKDREMMNSRSDRYYALFHASVRFDSADGASEMLVVATNQTVRGLSLKGKPVFTFETNLVEPIQHM